MELKPNTPVTHSACLPRTDKPDSTQNISSIKRKIVFSFLSKNKQRVPPALQSAVRSRMANYKKSQPGESQSQKNQSNQPNKFNKDQPKQKTDSKLCQICEQSIRLPDALSQEMYVSLCQHKDNFCESCLHHYVIYKVNIFEEVNCPHENCSAILDTNSPFFKNLPADIQKKYLKIHNFYLTSNNSELRMCPKQNCDGILRENSQNSMSCDICKNSYCKNCLLEVHEGQCDDQQVKFFQRNLHYRQCKQCLFIIEKNQGCNHMTCRCGYQFCYVCGQQWSNDHYCYVNENGVAYGAPWEQEPDIQNDNMFCLFCRYFCRIFLFLLKLPLKILMFIFIVPSLFLNILFQNIIFLVMISIGSIISGMFCYSFSILKDLELKWCLLGILFFPVTMIAGIVVGFQNLFCSIVPQNCTNTWRLIPNILRMICCF